MNNAYDVGAPKKAANLSVNSDLLAQAKKLGINISAVLEHSLADKVKMLKAEAWKRENKEAIEEYNANNCRPRLRIYGRVDISTPRTPIRSAGWDSRCGAP